MQVPQGRTPTAQALVGRTRAPHPVLPPGPLPTEGIDLAADAARALNWRGTVLPETTLLGRQVHLVAELRTVQHAERIAMGTAPVTDKATVSTWTWSELEQSAPPEAVEIIGVVAVARHWRTALAYAGPFTRYYPAAMVLPSCSLMTHDYVNNCLPRTRKYGVSVLSADENARVANDVTIEPAAVITAADANSRWINEVAYDQLLTTPDAAVPVQ